ncbi:MAG TPA: ABC transporter permease [Candidatus Hydrogenedentes bacterium]|nr:ABC transporter permease [Candidatus Hydrogenedentota bacterium]HOJ68356.1 ABC transporter permease [Candidatus Hydrogenedentota bacterium]HOK90927.1 ABC transporter permease [Candidatus Hydrogenedentota bacterium]HOV60393.1 ABC transporter permease [Candidatus Hydrogenedentota bacterium]
MSAIDHLLTALGAIAQNKVRSLLTTLGVIIGVMSVILLIALGESAQAYVEREFAVMGSNILIVTPGKQETTGLFPITAGSNRKLTYEIARDIKRKASGVEGVAANIVGLAAVKYGKRQRNVLTIGTTPDFDKVRKLYTQIGRFINDRDLERGNRVCVIGTTLKRELFGDQPALYKRVTINGSRHMVVGILEERGMALGIDLGDLCLIPLPSAQLIFNRKELFEILVAARNQQEIPRVEREVRRIILNAFDNDEDFTITDQEGMLSTFSRIFDMLRLMLVGIASISLLVGGIGIMNIMLVSVRERTREVGIRMAIGARRVDIALQFLIEAVTLSVLGGLIGIALGAVGAFTLHYFYPSLPIGISPWSAVTAFSFSLAVGVFFGVYPAVKAAGVDPVVALRYE